MPRTLKIHLPESAKSIKTPAATRHANRAIRNCAAGGSFGVIAINAGTTAIGSTTTNSELNASRAYSLRLNQGPWLCQVQSAAAGRLQGEILLCIHSATHGTSQGELQKEKFGVPVQRTGSECLGLRQGRAG